MRILQITACALPIEYPDPTKVFGFGDDERVYVWKENEGEWALHVSKMCLEKLNKI